LQISGAAAGRTQAAIKGSGTTMELVQPNPEEPQVMNISELSDDSATLCAVSVLSPKLSENSELFVLRGVIPTEQLWS
jgi:hypothetical protein